MSKHAGMHIHQLDNMKKKKENITVKSKYCRLDSKNELDYIQTTTLAGNSSRLNPRMQIKTGTKTRNMRKRIVLQNSA